MRKWNEKYILKISFLALMLLLFEPTKILGYMLLWMVFLPLFRFILNHKMDINLRSIICTIPLLAILCRIFYYRWLPSSAVKTISSIIGIDYKVLIIITAILLALIGNIILLYGASYLLAPKKSNILEKFDCAKENKKLVDIMFIVAIAIVTITFASKSSFLYPLNDWYDSNCFFTVGKAILAGVVPYADIYEQKGPILYFIHSFAALISSTSFIGVYLVEISASIAFLYISYRTLWLFIGRISVIMMPIIAGVVYCSRSFCHGDSAEELCLPLLAYTLFITVRSIYVDKKILWKQYFWIGATAGLVLWMKFTMLGFYFGCVIIPLAILVKSKEWAEIRKLVTGVLAGVLTVSVPVLLYFGLNGALADLFEGYFYNNIFIYSKLPSDSSPIVSVIRNIWRGFEKGLKDNIGFYALIILGFISCCLVEKKIAVHLIVSFLFSGCFIYCGSLIWHYYTLILGIFVPFGLIAIKKWFDITFPETFVHSRKFIIPLWGFVLYMFVVTLKDNQNMYLLLESNENLPQYQFASEINSIDNPTLLNYGFLDGGFYTVSGVLPNCKYFCGLNIELDELTDVQNQFIEEGLIDFVVTNQPYAFEKYELIDTASFIYEYELRDYYLYRLR